MYAGVTLGTLVYTHMVHLRQLPLNRVSFVQTLTKATKLLTQKAGMEKEMHLVYSGFSSFAQKIGKNSQNCAQN